MRRALVLLALLVLVLPASALGARATAVVDSDGTFAVKNGTATQIVIRGTGSIVGRFDYGKMWFTDPNLDDGTGPIVSGADSRRDLSDTKTYFAGFDVKFRSIGGRYRIVLKDVSGLSISAVGSGKVWIGGLADRPDGTFSLDGGPFRSLPDRYTGPFAFGG